MTDGEIGLDRSTCRRCGQEIERLRGYRTRTWRAVDTVMTLADCPEGGLHEPIRVRVTRRVLGFLSGTQTWADLEAASRRGFTGDSGTADWPEATMMSVVCEARRYKDGSVRVYLTRAELEVLLDYAESMWGAARDDAGWEPDALADLNAASALVRRIRTEIQSGRE